MKVDRRTQSKIYCFFLKGSIRQLIDKPVFNTRTAVAERIGTGQYGWNNRGLSKGQFRFCTTNWHILGVKLGGGGGTRAHPIVTHKELQLTGGADKPPTHC